VTNSETEFPVGFGAPKTVFEIGHRSALSGSEKREGDKGKGRRGGLEADIKNAEMVEKHQESIYNKVCMGF